VSNSSVTDLRPADAANELNGPVAVQVSGLHKTFHRGRTSVHVLKHVDLEVRQGELLVLLGPSGCGKTTLLRSLVGLERPSEGTIDLAGERVVDAARGLFTPPNRRNVGMVFQNYALWPHMKVSENVAYPLKARKLKTALQSGRVNEVLETVQCGHLADRYPPELSGGQQQRVSLARALAARPALLLLDEPLSNLDALLRIELRAQLRLLHREVGFTGVYVTHDQEEALALGSRVAVMNEGRIEQIGRPQDVYRRPATETVADFLGARNQFPLVVDDTGASVSGRPVPGLASRWPHGEYSLRVRPSRMHLRPAGAEEVEPENAWMGGGTVLEILPGVDLREHVIGVGDQRIFVDLPVSGRRYDVGDQVDIGFVPDATLCYRPDGSIID
jgi:iron(III) transport system ATP-binding protein